MPMLAMKDSRTKMVVSKVVTNKGVVDYAVRVVKKAIEQLGYKKAILKSDNEPAILVLKEAVRRETRRSSCRRSSSQWVSRECSQERAGQVQNHEGRIGEQTRQKDRRRAESSSLVCNARGDGDQQREKRR